MIPNNASSSPDPGRPAGRAPWQSPAELGRPQAAPGPIDRLWWLLAAVMVFGVGLRTWLSISTDFTIGDAFIIYRFAEQFAAGNGLVFNTGEWVGGNTSPLHTLLLGAGACSGMDVPWVARILGILCDVGAVFLLWRIFRAEGGIRSPLLQVAALAVTFLSPFLFFYSVSGMETPLYVLLILWVLDRTLRKLDWLWCLAVGLVFFCRPDGVIAVGAALLFQIWVTRKIPWPALAWTFAIGVAYLGFNYLLYDSLIPPTVKVKAVYYHNSVGMLFQYIADRFFFHRAWLLAGYILVMLAAMVICRNRPVVLLFGLTGVGYLLFALTAPYLRTWYVVPFLTFSACTILVGAASLAEGAKLPHLNLAVLGGLAVYLVASCVAYRVVFKECRVWRERIHELTEAAGAWLRDDTPPDAKIFVTALETGYFAKRYTWDAPGLVAPEVLRLIQSEPDIKLLEIASRVQADYAVILLAPQRDESHARFRLLREFRTRRAAAHMRLAEDAYGLYLRVDSTKGPTTP